MIEPRIIPQLLLSENKLVKTKKFKDPKYVGDPLNVIRIFNEKKVDELILLDISARKNNKINYHLLEQIAGECFMPICYGGGINSFDEARMIFSLGYEKICLNQALINNSKLVKKISNYFGSQSVVGSVNLKKNFFNKIRVYDSLKKKNLNIEYINFIEDSIKYGCGELFINFVDIEGTLSGLTPDYYNLIDYNKYEVPIILSGGINSLKNFNELFSNNIFAASAGAFFIYHGPHKAVLISYPKNSKS